MNGVQLPMRDLFCSCLSKPNAVRRGVHDQ